MLYLNNNQTNRKNWKVWLLITEIAKISVY